MHGMVSTLSMRKVQPTFYVPQTIPKAGKTAPVAVNRLSKGKIVRERGIFTYAKEGSEEVLFPLSSVDSAHPFEEVEHRILLLLLR